MNTGPGFSQNPLLLLATIFNKNPPLTQHCQNIEISNLRSGWQALIEPTLAKLLTM